MTVNASQLSCRWSFLMCSLLHHCHFFSSCTHSSLHQALISWHPPRAFLFLFALFFPSSISVSLSLPTYCQSAIPVAPSGVSGCDWLLGEHCVKTRVDPTKLRLNLDLIQNNKRAYFLNVLEKLHLGFPANEPLAYCW